MTGTWTPPELELGCHDYVDDLKSQRGTGMFVARLDDERDPPGIWPRLVVHSEDGTHYVERFEERLAPEAARP